MTATAQFYARHRYARITARKARLVADQIRGRTVNQALQLLEFAPQRAAAFYLKVLKSAVANASLDENVNLNRLFVSDCRADAWRRATCTTSCPSTLATSSSEFARMSSPREM